MMIHVLSEQLSAKDYALPDTSHADQKRARKTSPITSMSTGPVEINASVVQNSAMALVKMVISRVE